jgi:hypothetical protein
MGVVYKVITDENAEQIIEKLKKENNELQKNNRYLT